MTLLDFMNEFFDETWVFVEDPGGKVHKVWLADFLGCYPPVMDDIGPLLALELDGSASLRMEKNPEGPGQTPVVHVTLLKEGTTRL